MGSGGTLSGSGTLQAGTGGVLAQITATLSPALTLGGLTVDGNLTLATGSVLDEQINGTGTTQFAQLTVNGNVSLNNPTLDVVFGNSFTPAAGNTFAIVNVIQGDTITGTFLQGNSVIVGTTPFSISYGGSGNDVVLTVQTPVVTVPGAQPFVANKALTITGISVAEPGVPNSGGMVVQATLSVQNGTLSVNDTFLLSSGLLTFTQGNGMSNSSMAFSGDLAYVDLALSSLTYRANQDTAAPDTLTLTVSNLGEAMTPVKTINLTPQTGAFVVSDPVLSGKQDLVVQGTAGIGDTITVAPGKGTGAYAVTINGTVTNVTGVTGRILAFDLTNPTGNNSITFSSTVKLPGLLEVGNGNNTLVGGAGNDTLVAGSGSNKLDGGAGVNTLVESGNVDFTLVGGTTKASGSLTKGSSKDTLVLNHITQVQLSLTGPGSHTINGSAFSGPETLMGGSGNDTLMSGSGNDVLVGGSGNDSLVAGTGKDLLIAGGGADSLKAGSGGDLLIGGSTVYDNNLAALNAIMAEWTSADVYAVKIKKLMGTIKGGKNGNVLLTVTGTSPSVTNNHQASTLSGGAGLDWFFASAMDVKNAAPNKTVTTIF